MCKQKAIKVLVCAFAVCLLLAAAGTLRTCYKQAQAGLLRVTLRRTKVPQLKAVQPLLNGATQSDQGSK